MHNPAVALVRAHAILRYFWLRKSPSLTTVAAPIETRPEEGTSAQALRSIDSKRRAEAEVCIGLMILLGLALQSTVGIFAATVSALNCSRPCWRSTLARSSVGKSTRSRAVANQSTNHRPTARSTRLSPSKTRVLSIQNPCAPRHPVCVNSPSKIRDLFHLGFRVKRSTIFT